MATTDEDLEVMTPAELAAAEQETEARVAAARARPVDAEIERRVQEILDRPYTVIVWRDHDGYFVADAPDIEGCLGTGDSPATAIEDLFQAMAAWVESRLADGLPIPEPSPTPSESRYSGRVLLRLPRSLHRDLARAAEREGTSINQVVVALVAAGVGRGDVGLIANAVRALDTTGLEPGTPDHEFRSFLREVLHAIASGRRGDAAIDGAGDRRPALENGLLRMFGAIAPTIPEEEKVALLRRIAAMQGFEHVSAG